MIVKTIAIDLEAYEALSRRRGPGQSFSDVIKEHFRGGCTGRVLAKVLDGAALDRSTLEALEHIVRRRGADRAARQAP
jgi:predicted CopG family antitoxin